MWDPTSVIVLGGGLYIFYMVAGEDIAYDVRKSIHCKLICYLLNDNDVTPEYIYRVLNTMNMLGLFYPQYIYANRGQTWFDTSPFAKGVTNMGNSIINFFGGNDELSKYKKYSTEEKRALIDLFSNKPYSDELFAQRRAAYYGTLRFGCEDCTVPQPRIPDKVTEKEEYCREAKGDPDCAK